MSRRENIIKKIVRKLSPKKGYVEISGSIIPAPDLRWCGPEFKDDNFYLTSAEGEAQRLVDHFQCTQNSRILDMGCGQGRLPIGIIRVTGEVNYTGIDVDLISIDWCRRHIEERNSSFTFKHLDLYNERYNKNGIRVNDEFRLDLEDKSIDIIYLYSVFSHTTEEDFRAYLKDFSRILDDDGKIFFTTFVEEDVPDFSINPENYQLECSGPLHIVRYNKDYLFSIIKEYGYSVMKFTHENETNGQSGIYLTKNTGV